MPAGRPRSPAASRGNVGRAVERYRLCLDYIDRHPDGFDAASRKWYQGRIDRLLKTLQ